MDVFISPARKRLVEIAPLYFPFGGELSRDILKDFKGSQKTVKILFLGCFDLRNVLNTIASKTIQDDHLLTIHLNHPCPVSFARNVLVLKVITATDFSVNNAGDLSYLWDLWYNVQWPQTTLERFVKDIEDLIERGLPENCMVSNSNQLQKLKDIWNSWLSSLLKCLTQPLQMKKILKERMKFIVASEETCSLPKRKTMCEGLDRLVTWCEAAMVAESFPEKLKKKLRHEARQYYETGSCNPKKLSQSAALNPTLLEPNTHLWRIEYSSNPCPFQCYFPLPLSELETKAEEGIITRYCQKVLKNLVADFTRLKKNLQFHLWSSDDLQMCFSGTSEKFDVIDCSTLADSMGLANLIVSSSQRLENHSDSLLITESIAWWSVASTLSQYVEDSLCAPLSMIPTLYGLRLATHVELGSAIIKIRHYATGCLPVTLTWRQAPRYENVPLGYSSSLELCLKNLDKNCHLILKRSKQLVRENCGLKCYTPLTFNIVAAKLIELSMKEDQVKFLLSEVAPPFILAQKTFDDWANGRPLTIVKHTQPFTPALQRVFAKHEMLQAPMLRIVLIPEDNYLVHIMKNFELEDWQDKFRKDLSTEMPDVHYIDNMDFCYHANEGDASSLKVAFLLPKDHDFVADHCAVLIDILTGNTLMFIGVVKDMQRQTYDEPYLIKKNLLLQKVDQAPNLQVMKCEESKSDYMIKISIHAEGDPKDLNISTDREYPCEAGHSIIVSLAKPEGVKPLTLRFPYPFLVDCIGATLCRAKRFIQVVLKKALNEPWPCHFIEQPKLKVDQLNLWTEPRPEESVTEFMLHVGQTAEMESLHQSYVSELIPSTYRPPSPIADVRGMMASFFSFAGSMNYEYFVVCKENDPTKKAAWHIRAHLPIKKTPSGSPMILISAVDHCLSEKLIDEGLLDAEEAKEQFRRIFDNERKKQFISMPYETEEGLDWLRYVIRLNSTKMEPSSWQKKNLVLSINSPYLASYFAPLYMDNPISETDEEYEDRDSQIDVMKKLLGEPPLLINKCACCEKESLKLKRCTKCKYVYYCNSDCQRADWKTHKSICFNFDR